MLDFGHRKQENKYYTIETNLSQLAFRSLSNSKPSFEIQTTTQTNIVTMTTYLAAVSFGQDTYHYGYNRDVTKVDEVLLSGVIQGVLACNNGNGDDDDEQLQQLIMGNTTTMATATFTKHKINNNNNSNNIGMSIGTMMSVDANDDSALDLMREGLPSSPPNVTFDDNENKVLMEEDNAQQMPSTWLTERVGFWYDTSYSSSSSSSLTSSSSSSSLSSLSHSSRSDSLSINRKKSNSKRSNFYANTDTKHKHWSKQEDKMLRFEVNKFVHQDDINDNNNSNINWKEISMCQSFRRTRSMTQCKNRWYHHLQQHIKKGNWNMDEDKLIISMVAQGVGFGNWTKIANQGLPNRTPTQIRDRYVNALDPNIQKTRCGKKIPWTQEEDRILFKNQQLVGNKWTEIRLQLPGRTQLDVKNRYYNQKRKLARVGKDR